MPASFHFQSRPDRFTARLFNSMARCGASMTGPGIFYIQPCIFLARLRSFIALPCLFRTLPGLFTAILIIAPLRIPHSALRTSLDSALRTSLDSALRTCPTLRIPHSAIRTFFILFLIFRFGIFRFGNYARRLFRMRFLMLHEITYFNVAQPFHPVPLQELLSRQHSQQRVDVGILVWEYCRLYLPRPVFQSAGSIRDCP